MIIMPLSQADDFFPRRRQQKINVLVSDDFNGKENS